MKRILILIIGLIGVAQAQYSPTSAKTRFVNGLALGTKLDSYFNAADSNAIYWRADSVVMAKYKGTARALAFAVTGGYIPYSDTTTLFGQVVRTFGTQTVGGRKTFSNDLDVNGLTVGRGGGGVSTNAAFGPSALLSNTSGAGNTAIGNAALLVNTTSSNNTGVGRSSLVSVTGAQNTAIGAFSGGNLTTGSNNTYIGYLTPSSGVAVSNETIIGASAIGNGSNTVTIGNSSVVSQHLSGRVNVNGVTDNSRYQLNVNGNLRTSDSAIINNLLTASLDLYVGRKQSIGSSSLSAATLYVLSNDNTIPVIRAEANGTQDIFEGRQNNTTITSTITSTGNAIFKGFVQTNSGSSGGLMSFNYGASGSSRSWRAINDVAANGDFAIQQSTTQTGSTYADAIYINPSLTVSVPNNFNSLGVYNATVGGTNRDVFVDNTGLIGYVSSFRASKKNIVPMYATDWLHSLNPVTFNYRVKDKKGNYTDSAYNELEYGLIAEEVEQVNKEMVFYDVDSTGKKQLRGVHYSKLIIPLLAEVKEHKNKLDAQQSIIEALLTRIQKLEAKLN